jgi:multidrug resistance efflux pump
MSNVKPKVKKVRPNKEVIPRTNALQRYKERTKAKTLVVRSQHGKSHHMAGFKQQAHSGAWISTTGAEMNKERRAQKAIIASQADQITTQNNQLAEMQAALKALQVRIEQLEASNKHA